MNRFFGSTLAFFGLWLVVGGLILGGNSADDMMIGTIAGAIGAIFVFKKIGPPPVRGAGPSATETDFKADFAHDNIAIDSAGGKIWVCDSDGTKAVLNKSDLLRWELASTQVGDQHGNNRIVLHVRDLNRPKWTLPFKRHTDALRWSAKRNRDEAEEWMSRLTTWLHQ